MIVLPVLTSLLGALYIPRLLYFYSAHCSPCYQTKVESCETVVTKERKGRGSTVWIILDHESLERVVSTLSNDPKIHLALHQCLMASVFVLRIEFFFSLI